MPMTDKSGKAQSDAENNRLKPRIPKPSSDAMRKVFVGDTKEEEEERKKKKKKSMASQLLDRFYYGTSDDASEE